MATAAQPQDHSSMILFSSECQPSLGGSIDPSPFIDTNGNLYLDWKSNGGTGPATIWSEQPTPAAPGSPPMPPRSNCSSPSQAWEGGVVEAPDLITSGGRYFLFYSGNNWNSAGYAVGVATCTGPLGPCTKLCPSPSCPAARRARSGR